MAIKFLLKIYFGMLFFWGFGWFRIEVLKDEGEFLFKLIGFILCVFIGGKRIKIEKRRSCRI